LGQAARRKAETRSWARYRAELRKKLFEGLGWEDSGVNILTTGEQTRQGRSGGKKGQ